MRIAVPGGRVEGRAGGVAGDTLLVRVGDAMYRAPEATIDSLWVRDRRATHRAEVVGGVLEEECADVVRRFFEGHRG